MFLCFAVHRIVFWTPLRAFTINSLLLLLSDSVTKVYKPIELAESVHIVSRSSFDQFRYKASKFYTMISKLVI